MTRDSHHVAVWAEPAYVPLAEAVLELLGGDAALAAVGGPASNAVDELARRHGLEAGDDPRRLLIDRSVGSVLLLTRDPPVDRELLASACERSTLLTLEPLAAGVREAVSLGLGSDSGDKRSVACDRILTVPQMSDCPGYRRATDAEQALGPPRGVAIESVGRDGLGSLFARLYDAWATLLAWVELPESIDASIAGPLDPRDDLRKISGTLSAHARGVGGATLTVLASDRGGRDARRLQAIGESAQLTVTDAGYELVTLGGETIDRDPGDGELTTVADLVADPWRRALERGSAAGGPVAAPPPRRVMALACCEACLLSARTGQAESPRRVMEMQR